MKPFTRMILLNCRRLGSFPVWTRVLAMQWILTLTILSAGNAPRAVGQDDPFETPDLVDAGAGDAGSPQTQSVIQSDIKERSAVILTLRENPPVTVADHAHAIKVTSRIRRWDEVGRWLDSLAKLPLDTSSASTIVQQVGTASLVNIERNAEDLTDKQRGLVRKVLELSQRKVHDPKKLGESVRKLHDGSRSERVLAFRELQSAGNSGVAALLNGVLADPSLDPNETMREAFGLLGQSATSAWQAAMTTRDEEARKRLAGLISRTDDRAYAMELMTLDTAIASNPSRAARVQPFVYDQLQNLLMEYKRNRWSDVPKANLAWVLDADQRSLIQRNASAADLYLTRAGQMAFNLLRVNDASKVDSALATAAWLEYQSYFGDPSKSGPESLESILPESVRTNSDFACLVWDAATKEDLFGAQVLMVSVLGQWVNPTDRFVPTTVRERIVQGILSGNAEIRYSSAVLLVSSLHSTNGSDEASFQGRHHLDRVLDEMRRLDGRPLAMIIGGSENLRTHTAGLIETIGYATLEATSAKDTFASLQANQPVEAVFIVDHVFDMDLGQVMQRIRNRPSTASIPIALLASRLTRGEHSVAASDQRIVMSGVPPLIDQMGDIVRKMSAVTEINRIDSPERLIWQSIAQDYWDSVQAKTGASKNLVTTQMVPDTAAGQIQLLAIVRDSGSSVPQREQASNIFVQSVRQFGLLISSEMAKAQYDEYNARGPDDLLTRRVLGQVLDAIDAGNGNRAWPEVAP